MTLLDSNEGPLTNEKFHELMEQDDDCANTKNRCSTFNVLTTEFLFDCLCTRSGLSEILNENDFRLLGELYNQKKAKQLILN